MIFNNQKVIITFFVSIPLLNLIRNVFSLEITKHNFFSSSNGSGYFFSFSSTFFSAFCALVFSIDKFGCGSVIAIGAFSWSRAAGCPIIGFFALESPIALFQTSDSSSKLSLISLSVFLDQKYLIHLKENPV